MRTLFAVALLLAAVPAAAQTVPKIDRANCLAVARLADTKGEKNISRQQKIHLRACLAAYACDKAKQTMTNWDYAKNGDAPWEDGNETDISWRIGVCGE